MSYAAAILADNPTYWTRFADPTKPLNEVGTTPAIADYVSNVTPVSPGPADKAVRLQVTGSTADAEHIVYGDEDTVLAPGNFDFGADSPPYGAVAFEFWLKVDAFTAAQVYLYASRDKTGQGILYLVLQRFGDVFKLRFDFFPSGYTSNPNGPSGYSGDIVLPIDLGQWHHVVFNMCAAVGQVSNTYNDLFFDGQDLTVFFDTYQFGYLAGTTMDPSIPFGLYSDASGGQIDLSLAELAVYANARLSPAQVAAHIAAASGGSGSTGLGAKRIPLLGVG